MVFAIVLGGVTLHFLVPSTGKADLNFTNQLTSGASSPNIAGNSNGSELSAKEVIYGWRTVLLRSGIWRGPTGVLDKLRQREFEAGRYNPVITNLSHHMSKQNYLKFKPGAKHKTIDAAREAGQESGTRSILDIVRIGDEPDYEVAAPVEVTALESAFGTSKPSEDMLEDGISDILGEIDRGMCKYFFFYKGNKPIKICFAGYSYD